MSKLAAVAACPVGVLFLAVATTALGDIPGPGPHTGRPVPTREEVLSVPLSYRGDKDRTVSQLIIPRKFLPAGAAIKTSGGPAGANDLADSSSHARTVIAGVLLSLAAASVLLRRRSRTAKVLTVLVLVAAAAAIGMFGLFGGHQAAAATPPSCHTMPPAAPNPAIAAPPGEKVIITIAEQGDAVEFVHGTAPAK